MSKAVWAKDRSLLRLSGSDARSLLQDLVTNDLEQLSSGLVYAALLTPQGKYLFDFFVSERDGGLLLEVAADQAAALLARLTLYKLRADVTLETSDLAVVHGLGEAPSGAHTDPRHEALGWRLYTDDPERVVADYALLTPQEWTELRVEHVIPETGLELQSDQSYILEMGFERLSGVDFRKGCYVGQEVTARMKHKTVLKKGLVAVRLTGQGVQPGTEIVRDGKTVGEVHSVLGERGLAYVRHDRVGAGMMAGDAEVAVIESVPKQQN
ncbi:MAG: folate-binding protein [Pseudomonadota bacterium]